MNKINILSHNWLALKINNDCLNRNIGLIRGRAVDLGCGAAPYKSNILKVADEYIGVDWENGMHDQSNVDVFADLTKPLPFRQAYADTIVSFQVMEHLPEPELFLKECHRILKHGGKILLTTPFMWHVHEAPYDYCRYTRYGLKYLFEKAGFIDVNINENTGFWQTWVLKFNYHTTRYARGLFKYIWVPLWWLDQVVAPILDKYDNNPNECASYTVRARKP